MIGQSIANLSQLFTHVRSVVNRYHDKLSKEDLKKFAKEVNKKLASSDYRNKRVDDPTKISEKQIKKVKAFVKDFFDRAVQKKKEHDKRKAEKAAKAGSPSQPSEAVAKAEEVAAKDDDIVLTDIEDTPDTPSSDRKRKREDDVASPGADTASETPSVKRVKEDDAADVPSPPPPPPPPTDTPLTEEERSMREQEEALMRENEEAQRMEDQAGQPATTNGAAAKQNGVVATFSGGDVMDIDQEESLGAGDSNGNPLDGGRKQEVMSH